MILFKNYNIIYIYEFDVSYFTEITITHTDAEDHDEIYPITTVKNSPWKEKELIKWILQDYDKRSRPVFDNITKIITTTNNEEIQQITVEFGLRLIQILDLNEMEQVLTTSVRLLYVWVLISINL